MVLQPAPIADFALRRNYGTPLVHDIDAIATFDLNAQAAPSQIEVNPSKTVLAWQAPTITLTTSAAPHAVTLGAVIHGRDDRGIDIAVPVLGAITTGVGAPDGLPVGYCFSEIQLIVLIVKAGAGAGDVFNLGYDLSVPVAAPALVLLADEIFQTAAIAVPMTKQTDDITQEQRHIRWVGATKPTAAASKLILCTQPPVANIV